MASKTFLGVECRMVECPNCGAPVETPQGGGQTTCRFCSASVLVRARPVDFHAAQRSASEEVARLSRLRAQVDHPVHGHVYDLDHPPPRFATFGARSPDVEVLSDEWRRLKTQPTSNLSEGFALCWVALALAQTHFSADEDQKGRAVLETAVDQLSDPGHRHIVRCRLAREAAARGQAKVGAAWLLECDATPELLELDGEYRIAKARVCLASGDADGAFAAVGSEPRTIPVDPPHVPYFEAIRVGAVAAKQGETAAAARLRLAETACGMERVHRAMEELRIGLGLVHSRRAEIAEAQERRRNAAKRAKRRSCGCCLGFVIVSVVGTVVGILLWINRPMPLSCATGSLTVDGRKADLDEILIDAGNGCHITIKNSKLKGRMVVKGGTNVVVNVENSDLTGSDGVISVGAGSAVIVSGKSTLRGKNNSPTIWAAQDSTIELVGTTFKGSDGEVVRTTWNADVSMTGVTIKSGSDAPSVVLGYDSELDLNDVQMTSDGALIEMGYRGKLTAKKSKLTAGETEDGQWPIELKWDAKFSGEQVEIISPKSGINVGYSSTVELLDQSSLTAEEGGAIKAGYGFTFVLTNSRVAGDEYGVLGFYQSNFTISDGSEIRSDAGDALRGSYKCELELRSSKLIAADTGLSLGYTATVTAKDSQIAGKKHSLVIGRDSNLDLGNTKTVGPTDISAR